jgi:phosphate acyltransferase
VTTSDNPRIAIDAMGGDFGPSVVVAGVLAAARRLGPSAQLVCIGEESAVRAEIEKGGGASLGIEIVHAPENIGMDEAPAAAIRRKPNSPIVVGATLMKEGRVDAFVSAGSTGAVTAAATLIVGRLPGVARPGIATMLPSDRGVCLVIDMGANVDSKPQHLLQYAVMGRIYAEHVLGHDQPTVGLLNIGEEPGKGNELTQQAYELLAAHEPAFIGNVEGKHIFDGRATVIVTDGFVGNVVLKNLESFGGFLVRGFRDKIRNDLRAKIGAWLLRPALREFSRRFDYAEYGGAPLLGCRGVVIIAHGSSSSEAISNAVRVADRGVRDRIASRIQEEIEREQAEIARAATHGGATASQEGSDRNG